nr:MAG TPA: hypothetical protein [Caudoviricetes sp.]
MIKNEEKNMKIKLKLVIFTFKINLHIERLCN